MDYTDYKPTHERDNFIVSPYPDRPTKPWKLEIRKSFAGKKIRQYFTTDTAALLAGEALVEQIRKRGTDSLRADGLTVAEGLRKWVPRAAGMSLSHRDKVAWLDRLLTKELGPVPMRSVTPTRLESILNASADNDTTKATNYRYFRMFFRWAHRFEHIDRNPMTAIDIPISRPAKNVLSVPQLKELLNANMPPWLWGPVVLSCFSGLRIEEISKMNWEDIDIKTGQIHVRPGVQKDTNGEGPDERIVDFTKPLLRRKKELKGEGPIMPISLRHFHAMRREFVKALGWAGWPKGALRHSFATYHLAECKNAGLTAFQMGHTSPVMVQKVYAVPATKANWKAWWAL